MPVGWCRDISEIFRDAGDRGGVKMDIKKWRVILEKKDSLKMGKEIYSNIKYLSGLSAAGIAWVIFQLVNPISGFKNERGVSHHLNWQEMTRLATQMFVP